MWNERFQRVEMCQNERFQPVEICQNERFQRVEIYQIADISTNIEMSIDCKGGKGSGGEGRCKTVRLRHMFTYFFFF